MRPILEYGAVCWDPYREGQVSVLNRVQKRAIQFENNSINESGWEALALRGLIARICAHFKAYTGRRAWKAIGDRLLKPCCLNRGDRGSTVVKVLCYKSEGRWFDPSLCQWIFH